MKNARTKKSGNRNERDAADSTAKRQSARASGKSRSDDSARANKGFGTGASAFRASGDAGLSSEPERENRRTVAPDGERGADSRSGGDGSGSDSGGDGGERRGRGRPRSPERNARSGNAGRDHADAAQGQEPLSEGSIREIAEEDKPLKNRPGKRGGRKSKGSMKGAMVMVLGQASATLFACVALLTEHDHWYLEKEESDKLGEALDKCFATLPERAYEKVIEISEKWHPWIQLVVALGVILWDRIEESSRLAQSTKETNNQRSDGGANGSGGTERAKAHANYRPYHSSLGYDN